MDSPTRTATHHPAVAAFAAAGALWVFVLVSLGAFTTSIGAGMAFPDWPLSNGSLNPEGWLEDISMFAEHSHRLSGATMGLITLGLAGWLWRVESRRWVRVLSFWAVGVVIVQGLFGGTRVLLDAVAVPGFTMSLGQMLRIPHGVLAQLFVCLLFALAAVLSRGWIERPLPLGDRVRRVGLACCALLVLQLVVATTMRHNAAGLAIVSFPYSTPDGHWLPAHWDFRVALHFAHRVLALVLAFALTAFAFVIRRDRAATVALRAGASALISLLVLQILLGMQVIFTLRRPSLTTAHVIVGTLLLALTFWLTWMAHRDRLEQGTRA